MWIWFLVVFVAGFASGWAFFKHRQDIKDAAKAKAIGVINKV